MQSEWPNIFHSPAERHEVHSHVEVRSQSPSQSLARMVLMESYLFCASVRLGVIGISFFALFKSVIIIYVLSIEGLDFSLSLIATFDNNLGYRTSYYMVRDTIYWLEQYPEISILLMQLYCIFHICSCILAAYGAYKLKKYLVLPLAIFEFFYIAQIITLFVLFLRILRHFISIGRLILLTLVATAYSLLVIYDFLALASFEQIVRLVQSKRYQQLYGSDPFNPILNPTPEKPNFPNIVVVMPKMEKYLPKWWQMENLEANKENLNFEDAHKYFQSQEILPEVLLHNAINLGYTQKKVW